MNDNEAISSVQDLVQKLRNAAATETPNEAVQALLTDLVADPQRVRDMLPNYVENDVILFEDDSISIWHCRFMPGFAVPAHDHQTHATIAVYDGAERNDFFEKGADGSLSKTREVVLEAGGILEIGPDDIHSVACASETPCCGIHVYLAALTQIERSLFDTERGEEMRFSDKNYNRLTGPDS
jgi:3-mercaptopropionate dioxygenase